MREKEEGRKEEGQKKTTYLRNLRDVGSAPRRVADCILLAQIRGYLSTYLNFRM